MKASSTKKANAKNAGAIVSAGPSPLAERLSKEVSRHALLGAIGFPGNSREGDDYAQIGSILSGVEFDLGAYIDIDEAGGVIDTLALMRLLARVTIARALFERREMADKAVQS